MRNVSNHQKIDSKILLEFVRRGFYVPEHYCAYTHTHTKTRTHTHTHPLHALQTHTVRVDVQGILYIYM